MDKNATSADEFLKEIDPLELSAAQKRLMERITREMHADAKREVERMRRKRNG